MPKEKENYSKKLLGKTVVSKTGKRFGKVQDLKFETKTGEIVNLILNSPTRYADTLDLETNREGSYVIPFNAVIAVGDFVVVAEEDIV